MNVIYENLRNKLRFKEIPDSEIIQEMEYKYPRFDINWTYNNNDWTLWFQVLMLIIRTMMVVQH